MTRPFRFGVQASTAVDRVAWVDLARRVESHGYDTLTMPDHFDDQLAPLPALMAAADATDKLRIGALVWDNDYKHPVVMAKELATLDLLSDGRLELGIGAGWMATDYERSGIPYDPPGVRIDRFIEGLDIIERAFTGEPFSYAGTHYTITDFTGTPRPVQARPPLLIGAGGPRMLRIAAARADIIGINPTMTAGVIGPEAISTMTAEAVDTKVDGARTAAGERWSQIELNIRAFIVNVTDHRQPTVDAIAGAIGVDASMIANTPFALVGTPAQLVDDLRQRRDRWGFSYIIVGADDIESFAPVVAELAGT